MKLSRTDIQKKLTANPFIDHKDGAEFFHGRLYVGLSPTKNPSAHGSPKKNLAEIMAAMRIGSTRRSFEIMKL